jgi:cell division septation protein DedD
VRAGVEAWEAGDFATAVAEWQGPARAGDADALFNLAQAHRLGRGVAADSAKARKYYAEAAERGHIKAADNYGLLLFQEGEQEKAIPLVRAAAERGDPRAQYVLGLAHFNGDYAPKDWVRAYAMMTLANGAGLPQASAALGQMDEYVPLTQRQQAQSLARKLDESATSQRSAMLAASDLGARPASVPVVAAAAFPPPAPVTVTGPVPVPVPASTAGATPIPSVARVVTPAAPGALQAARPGGASTVTTTTAAAVRTPAAATASPQGKWRVQLGAFGVTANADKLWNRLASNPALAGTSKTLVPAGKVTRLLATGFASKAAAEQSCAALQKQGQACLVAGSQ